MSNSVRPLRIVLASSEAVPFSKTGGLADVVGALAKSLDQLGHDVTLIVPDYFLMRQSAKGLPTISETGLAIYDPDEWSIGHRHGELDSVAGHRSASPSGSAAGLL